MVRYQREQRIAGQPQLEQALLADYPEPMQAVSVVH